MESSLARLHDDFSVSLKFTNATMLLGRKPQSLATFFSPPHARHEEADDNPVHPTEKKGVWIKNVVEHCRWRQQRGCARMVFLRWSETEKKGVWIKNVVEHFKWRQQRGCARMVFLRWSEVMGREKAMRLAKIVSQLQQELDEVEIQLAESYDPARTQVRFTVQISV